MNLLKLYKDIFKPKAPIDKATINCPDCEEESLIKGCRYWYCTKCGAVGSLSCDIKNY